MPTRGCSQAVHGAGRPSFYVNQRDNEGQRAVPRRIRSLFALMCPGVRDLDAHRKIFVRKELRLVDEDRSELAQYLHVRRIAMIHITDTTELDRTIWRVDGRLTADDVSVLDRRCGEVGKPHVLDLTGLQSADSVGSEELRRLASDGVEIRGASPYIQLLINDPA